MMCDKNKVIYNKVIPPYMTVPLKHSIYGIEWLSNDLWYSKHSMCDSKNWITSSTTINIAIYFWYTRNSYLFPAAWIKKNIY